MIIRPAQPIATTTKSSTDRRAVFVSVSNESGIVDLLIPQRTERFGQLRCIYIDTSAQDSSGNGCMIETDLGQNVQAPAGTQGYYPVFIPFVSKLTVSSNESVNLLLLDFDVQPSQWHVANASSVVPNPLHVIVDDQPLTTNATVQNWPASQHVTLDGQPINVNSTVQNFPANFGVTQSGAWSVGVNNFPASQHVTLDSQPISTNGEGIGLGFAFIGGNGSFVVGIGPTIAPVNAVTAVNVFGLNYTNTSGPQIILQLGTLNCFGRMAIPFSSSPITGELITLNGLNLNVGSVQSSITAVVSGSGTMGGSLLLQVAYR